MPWFEHGSARIYYEDQGEGSPVLFLPGWSESIDEFAELRGALAGGHRVIAADLPGSGKSGPQPRSYAPTYYEDDAIAFLALIAELSLERPHVAGFSDGGEVALVMAARNAEALRSVVAWGAVGQTPPLAMIDAFHNVVDQPSEAMGPFSQHLQATYGEGNARLMSQSVAAAWRAIAQSGDDISRSRAPGITCPTLLITGDHDPFAPPAPVAALAAAIPEAEFIEVTDAGHVLHTDHGEWLAETITGWIARHDD
jgi:valacyclovir hydrolase